MPLYEYQCKKCKHRFEKIQSFSDAPIKKCPECGSSVEKLLSAPAVHFKGSGFYVTDYAKKSAAETGAAAGKTEAKGAVGDGAATPSETKGEQKVSEAKSEKSESKPAPEPKGDPRGRSSHSKKAHKR